MKEKGYREKKLKTREHGECYKNRHAGERIQREIMLRLENTENVIRTDMKEKGYREKKLKTREHGECYKKRHEGERIQREEA